MATDYGTDLSCLDDFTEECADASGLNLLAEALVRRLITPRGMVIDDADYGTDLRECIGLEQTSRNEARIVADVKAECEKDERVLSVTVEKLQLTVASRTLYLEIVVTPIEDEPFRLTLTVDAVTVEALVAS
jgi:FAD synthase